MLLKNLTRGSESKIEIMQNLAHTEMLTKLNHRFFYLNLAPRHIDNHWLTFNTERTKTSREILRLSKMGEDTQNTGVWQFIR